MTTTDSGAQVLNDLRPLHRDLRHAIPDVYQGFGELSKAAFADGAWIARPRS